MNLYFIITLLLIFIILFLRDSIEKFDTYLYQIVLVKHKDYVLIHITDNNSNTKIYKIYKNIFII